MNIKDMAGLRFGRLLVIEPAGILAHRKMHWRCVCDCGREAVVVGGNLRQGITKSCGCLAKETGVNSTHGLSHTKMHKVWRAFRGRCNNKRNRQYKDYGGRGITCAPEWDDFAVFYADMHPSYYEGALLDRTDNDLGYSKENCRWTDRTTQNSNRRNNVILYIMGRYMALASAARVLNIAPQTIRAWRKKGLDDAAIESRAAQIHSARTEKHS